MEVSVPYQSPETLLAQRVREFRQAREWSQEDLAKKMQDLGFKWLQSTAAKTEHAARPVRVDEAVALAGLFEVSIDDLVHPETPSFITRLQCLNNAHSAALRYLEEAEKALRDAQGRAAAFGKRVEKYRSQNLALAPLVDHMLNGAELNFGHIAKIVLEFSAADAWEDILREFQFPEKGTTFSFARDVGRGFKFSDADAQRPVEDATRIVTPERWRNVEH